MTDRWLSLPVRCKGGLSLDTDALTSGTQQPGSARVLQNFECALEGGYRRISGYQKWDTNTVPGTANNPILGVKAAFGGVFAARKLNSTPTTDIYFSSGSGWGSRINTGNRGGSPTKVRFHDYFLFTHKIVGCDGVNQAFTYDGTTYTLLNGTGAPADPTYVEFFKNRLIFAGYSSNTAAITLTSPNTDNDFNAANGAIELNVGDTVTGLKTFRDDLYIFSKNAIWKLVGNSATDFALESVTTEIGCLNSDTIQEVGGDLLYLAPDGFRSVAGTYNIGDVDLSLQSRSIQPLVRTMINDTGNTIYSSVPIRKKSQYRCWPYNSSVSKANATGFIGKLEQGSPLQAFNYVYTTYAWSTTLGIQPYSADSYFDSGIERVVIGDPTNGYVYQLESGNDFDGSSISAIYQSPYLTFQDATIRKVLQKATVYTSFEGTNTINLGVLFDFQDSSVLQPQATQLSLSGGAAIYGTAVYDTDTYSQVSFPIFKPNLIGSGFTASMNFTSTGGAPYRIDSFQIVYAPKGRR